jgi:hypothetical protein
LEEELPEQRFPSVSFGEDGGKSANNAAREASNPTERDARAAGHNGRISVDGTR